MNLPDFDLVHTQFDERSYLDTEKERLATFKHNWDYYKGNHRKFLQITTTDQEVDDNVSINYCGILVDRSVARLFGDPARGTLFTWDIDNDKAKAFLEDVWERSGSLNKYLSRLGVFGAVDGQFISKVIMEDDGERVIAIDPGIVGILSNPDDVDKVLAYKIQYQVMRRNPNRFGANKPEKADFRQLIVKGDAFGGDEGWFMQDFIRFKKIWVPDSAVDAWVRCPIYDGQNLPNAQDVWGQSDLANVIGLNDEMNFLMSNVNRIVRFHAHPRTIGIGVEAGSIQESSVESFWTVASTPDKCKIYDLEMKSDLGAVFSFFQVIREAFWTIGREADPATFKEKIGNVTNFGLRVLFLDALNKLGQKREAYGKVLVRLAKDLLRGGGFEDGIDISITWSDPLPSDPREAVETMMLELDCGVLSRFTAMTERGRDPKKEGARIKGEQAELTTDAQRLMKMMRGGGGSSKPNIDQRNMK